MKNLLIVLSAICAIVLVLAIKVLLVLAITYALIRFVPKKQEVQFFTNEGKVTYYWVEKSTDKNSFDYQMYYFAKQLIPHNFYRISDIVTDKAPRNTNKVHK